MDKYVEIGIQILIAAIAYLANYAIEDIKARLNRQGEILRQQSDRLDRELRARQEDYKALDKRLDQLSETLHVCFIKPDKDQ